MTRPVIALAALIVTMLSAARPLLAGTVSWTNAGVGDWSDVTNWTGGKLPASSDDAYITNCGTVDVTMSGAVCSELHLGPGSLNLSGTGLFSVNSYEYLGYSGTCTITQTGGTHTSAGDVYLGYYAGCSATYKLSGAGQMTASAREYIGYGYAAAGSFIQTSGSHTVKGTLCLGMNTGSSGTYQLSDTGQLNVGYEEYLGDLGAGVFTQTGGTHAVRSALYLGFAYRSTGTYQLGGSGQLTLEHEEYIGDMGDGIFVQTGGTHTVGSGIYFALFSGASGAYQLSGTGQLKADWECLGHGGIGTFSQSGGNHTVNSLQVGDMLGAAGTYVLSGNGQLTTANVVIGLAGTGTFIQTGGLHNVTGGVTLGSMSGVPGGTYQLSDSGQLTAVNEVVGDAGRGAFTQTGGTNTVSGGLSLGLSLGSIGNYQLSSSGQLTTAYEYLGNSGTGSFTQTGGIHTVGVAMYMGCSYWSNGSYVLSGTGQLTASNEYVGNYGSGIFIQTGGTHTVSAGIYLGCISGGQSGTYQLSGTGRLAAGSLYIGYSGTGTFSIIDSTAAVSVSSVLSFGDKGTFNAPAGSEIHLSGNAVQNLCLSSTRLSGLANLNLIVEGGPGVTASIETAGKDQGTVAAVWTNNFVLGTLTLGGTAAGRIKLVNSTDNQPTFIGPEALYVNTLVMNTGAAVDFNGLNLYYANDGIRKRLIAGDASLDGKVDMADYVTWFNNFGSTSGLGWTGADFNGDGKVDMSDYVSWFNNFGQDTTAPVPEPATLAMLALGLPLVRRRGTSLLHLRPRRLRGAESSRGKPRPQ